MRVKGTGAGELEALYLDYVDNYMTVEAFAADRGMTPGEANRTVLAGLRVHKAYVDWCRGAEVARHLTVREQEALYKEFSEWWGGRGDLCTRASSPRAAALAAWLHCHYKHVGLDFESIGRRRDGRDECKETGD